MKEIRSRVAERALNIEQSEHLRDALQTLLDHGSRINANKRDRYWYPLSIATYGIDEIMGAVDSLCSYQTTMWTKTFEFERRFAALLGTPEAVMVNSGSSADLLIALALLDRAQPRLAKGDEVLVPSITWPTQIWSLLMAGLSVRFVDTDPRTLNVDLEDLQRKIGPRTRAISLVHLLGNPVDMDVVTSIVQKHDLVLLEDCCEALGATYRGKRVGTFGLASSFSFFFSHHITTMEGGMVCTDDTELSDLLRVLRAHGWARNTKYLELPRSDVDPRYMFVNWGLNVRPTEIQAAFGLEQLERLRDFQAARLRNVEYAKELFAPFQSFMRSIDVAPNAECAWFALPFLLAEGLPFRKRELLQYLDGSGIETRPIVAGNLMRQPVHRIFPELGGMDLAGADAVHDRGFYIGLYPVDSREQLERVAAVIDAFFGPYS